MRKTIKQNKQAKTKIKFLIEMQQKINFLRRNLPYRNFLVQLRKKVIAHRRIVAYIKVDFEKKKLPLL